MDQELSAKFKAVWQENKENYLRAAKERSEKLRKEYYDKPKLCKLCAKPIKYENKADTFCGRDCWKKSLLGNRHRSKDCEPDKCLYCGNTLKASSKKYCSSKCQQDHIYKVKINEWLEGKWDGGTVHRTSHYVKRWLIETYTEKCMSPTCGWDWTKPCVVEIEHKDGDSQNNRPENLMLICPNCHSNTPTYKNKNRGNGRAFRRQRYAEGKSY